LSSIRILVLNYNGLGLLQECLPSVVEAARRSPVPCRVSIVDNVSRDGARDWVAQALPSVQWLAQPANDWLRSYNAVVPQCPEKYVLLLNNDIRLEPDAIAPLYEALEADPTAFAAAPRYLDFEGAYNGGMHRCGRRFATVWAGPNYPGAEAESFLPGVTLYNANGLFRRDRFVELGGFDPLFAPVYWEDTDLCAKAWGRGWPTLYVPASLIHHKASATARRLFSDHSRHTLGYRNAALWLLVHAPTAEVLKALAWMPLAIPAYLLTGRWAQAHGLINSLPLLRRALAKRDRGADRAWWPRFSAPALGPADAPRP
jgi:GT2 family glycosyltransferase